MVRINRQSVPRRTGALWRWRIAAAGAGGVLAAGMVVAAAGPAAAGGPPVVAFTPSPYDYGQVAVGQTAAKTFTLANTGGKASRALKVTLAGAAAFTITADTCTGTSLGPGKSCRVAVRFAATAPGTITATLTAANNKKAVLATDALTGTGAATSHIYWASFGSGTISQANLDGSSPHTIVSGQGGLVAVAVHGSHIYWANYDAGTISEANLNGTGVTTLVTGLNHPFGVAVDGSHIYWSNNTEGTGEIDEANLNGTGVTPLVTGLNRPFGVAVGPQ
jgi:hypothetical protein